MHHPTFLALKTRQRAERHQHPAGMGLRVHRALSWLQRAEQETEDFDAKFIFLWIAFNAAYASQSLREDGFTEQAVFKRFLSDLIRLDHAQKFSSLVWSHFPQAIRVLLDNQYVFQPFWDAQSQFSQGQKPNFEWEQAFALAKQRANDALRDNDTLGVLMAVFSRLYTLRNQLLHGGATWNSGVNRDQVRDGVRLMGTIVPLVIEIMLDHPEEGWEMPMYPVVSR